jgi:predicted lipoprotein
VRDVSKHEVLESLTDEVIIPRFQALALELEGLSRSLSALCDAPDEANLLAAREHWRLARTQLKRSEVLWFGPVMQRRSWQWIEGVAPDRERIEEMLLEQDRIDANWVRDFLGTTQVGLMTIEYLLFGEDAATLHALGDAGSPRCQYLEALGQVAATEGGLILDDWTGAGASESAYADVFNGNAPRSLNENQAMAEPVRHMVFLLREITAMTWGVAVGGNGGELLPAAIPGGEAQHAAADLRSQLMGIQEIYLGAEGGDPGLGMGDIIRQFSVEIDQGIIYSLQLALAAVDEVEEPMGSSILENPAPARAAVDRVITLQQILNTEVSSLLNVSIGFNDRDGDS